MEQRNWALLPGDRRQKALCALLEAGGDAVTLLPSPELWGKSNLPPPGTVIPVASADAALRSACAEYGFTLLEYGRSPLFLTENGAITAENALSVAMNEGKLLRGSHALVIGGGHIARPLVSMLHGIGARVTAAARRPEAREELRALGAEAVPMEALAERLAQADWVFNTVPAPVLDAALLKKARPGCVLIDLASAPGGMDLEAAHELGLRAFPARGLPGRCTPAAAAAAIADTIREMMKNG